MSQCCFINDTCLFCTKFPLCVLMFSRWAAVENSVLKRQTLKDAHLICLILKHQHSFKIRICSEWKLWTLSPVIEITSGFLQSVWTRVTITAKMFLMDIWVLFKKNVWSSVTGIQVFQGYVHIPAGFSHGILVSSSIGNLTVLGKVKYCGKETSTLYSIPLLWSTPLSWA